MIHAGAWTPFRDQAERESECRMNGQNGFQSIRKFLGYIHFLERTILVVSSTLTFMGICIAVSLRYFFRQDLFGLEEILMILGFWLYFVGGAYGSYTRTQIKAELLDFIFSSARIKGVIKSVCHLVSVAMAGCLCWWSVEMLIFGLEKGAHTPVFNLPMATAHIPLIVGFFLMMVYTMAEFVDEIRGLRSLERK
jgi:TRAP-type C4-dicarboxylate transport system permease small subunit